MNAYGMPSESCKTNGNANKTENLFYFKFRDRSFRDMSSMVCASLKKGHVLAACFESKQVTRVGSTGAYHGASSCGKC